MSTKLEHKDRAHLLLGITPESDDKTDWPKVVEQTTNFSKLIVQITDYPKRKGPGAFPVQDLESEQVFIAAMGNNRISLMKIDGEPQRDDQKMQKITN